MAKKLGRHYAKLTDSENVPEQWKNDPNLQPNPQAAGGANAQAAGGANAQQSCGCCSGIRFRWSDTKAERVAARAKAQAEHPNAQEICSCCSGVSCFIFIIIIIKPLNSQTIQ